MKTGLVVMTLLNSIGLAYTQAPSGSNFNIVFENNFEDNQVGRYVHSEYITDWNLPSYSSMHEKEIVDMIVDENQIYNKIMRGYYPKGTYLPDNHGFLWRSFYSEPLTEVYFSYDIKFKPGFEWVLGGKIPGVVGGTVVEGANQPIDAGFSARIMWKENGRFVFYVYHQDLQQTYGNSYYIENFNCISGKWYNITIRVVLNTINSGIAANDGILEGFIDGKLMFQKTDFKFRSLSSIKIDNMYISSFFGGGTDAWAAARDEWIDFDNFVSYTYSSSAINVPRNNVKSSPTKLLLHPYYSFGSANIPSSPSTPSEFLSTTQTASTIALSWEDKSTNEQGFQLERSMVPNSNFEPIATIAANTISYMDTGLDPDKMYYYRIKAFNATGSSSYVTLQQATSPALPTNAQKAGFAEIFANVSGAVNRRALPVTMQESGTISSISIFHNGGTGNALLGIYNTSEALPDQRIAITSPAPVNTSAGWQTFKLTTPVEVSKGSTIWLAWVFENGISLRYTSGEPGRAHSEDTYAGGLPQAFGTSTISASVYSIYANYVPMPSLSQIPDPPSNLHVIQSDYASATIGWRDNAQNENGFEIERINAADDTRKTFAMESNIVSLADNDLTENSTYQYRIRAFNAEGSSAWSGLLTIVTPQKETETPVVTEPVDPTNNRPVMANQQFNISEQSLKDNILGSVAASDPDGQK
ncbi:MAG: fibronectin type III domain-containing protein, partial [Bacteroidales bacterium]|nr:fibronectin type III domain-containing protein [Bacteroidales bacterium]